jgi:hypothetical protein
LPGFYDPAYPARLAPFIKKAKKTAGIRPGRGVLVTGGPDVIIRRFTWPDMPPAALYDNAKREMAPYLPGDGEAYAIGCRRLRKITPEAGKGHAQLEILIAAIPKRMVEIYLDACRRAGLRPKRVDVRENAREKLVREQRLWESGEAGFDPRQPFAFLDTAEAPSHLTVFLNGIFYASRYLTGGDDASEAASALDYIQYKERIKNIPLINIADHLKINGPAAVHAAAYMDAYGAAVKAAGELNLKPAKPRAGAGQKMALPAAFAAVIIAALVSIGLYFPGKQADALKTALGAKKTELERLNTVPESDLSLISDIHRFRSQAPSAAYVAGTVHNALPPGTLITSLLFGGGKAELKAWTDDLDKVAVMLETLRRNDSVTDAGARLESVTYPGGTPHVVFHMALALRGGPEVPYETT